MNNLTPDKTKKVITKLEELLEKLKYSKHELIFLCTTIGYQNKKYLIKPTIDNEFAAHYNSKYFTGTSTVWWNVKGKSIRAIEKERQQVTEIMEAKIAYVEDLITYYKQLL